MSATKNNDDKSNITLDLNISNFGPHKTVNFQEDVPAINMCIYADNGRGKTIISTLFDLLKDEPTCLNCDVKELVSFGQDKGNFSFSIKNNKNSKEEKYSFEIDRNVGLSNKCIGKYIFHVFNDGFIAKNLQEQKYKTDLLNKQGTIAIIGKTHIDLKEKERQLADLKEMYSSIENSLKTAISEVRAKVKANGVSAHFDVFKNIKYESIFNPINPGIKPFETVKTGLDAISAMPEAIDVQTLSAESFAYDNDLFESIFNTLKKPFTRSTISDTVKSKIKSNRSFYESGMSLYNSGGPCPFCGQDINDLAQNIIAEYETFFKDEEAKIANIIRKDIEDINGINNVITQTKLKYSEICTSFNSLKKYSPRFSADTVENMLDFKGLEESLSKLVVALNTKNGEIEKPIPVNITKENIKAQLLAIAEAINSINNKVSAMNEEKNTKNASIKNAKRDLCISALNDFKKKNAQNILQIQKLENDIKACKEDIRVHKIAGSVEKKDKIYELFQKLLEKVFVNKYSFDSKTGEISFKGEVLRDNIHFVLSEGERRILAFCYYLALTYDCMKSEEDRDKIIFVMDDPVSSLDFNYVYAVAQLINEISTTFGAKYKRCIILTHHLEFLNILIANNIVPVCYLLDSDGKIKSINVRNFTSYFNHLNDIVEFSKLSDILSYEHPHTISNSLRNILETISKFKYDTTNLDNFIKNEKDSILSKNVHLVKMINDLSHGGFRSGIVIPHDALKSCCNTVIEYLRQNFPGQLNAFQIKKPSAK